MISNADGQKQTAFLAPGVSGFSREREEQNRREATAVRCPLDYSWPSPPLNKAPQTSYPEMVPTDSYPLSSFPGPSQPLLEGSTGCFARSFNDYLWRTQNALTPLGMLQGIGYAACLLEKRLF